MRAAYKRFVKQGDAWQLDVAKEKAAVTELATSTCPKYLANPNGDTALQTFLASYTQAMTQALVEKKSADELQSFTQATYKQVAGSMWQLHFDLDQFPCGKSLKATSQHIQDEVAGLEKSFHNLRTQCPAIAKLNADSAQKTKVAPKAAAPNSVPKGKNPIPASDITGVQQDQNKQKTPDGQ